MTEPDAHDDAQAAAGTVTTLETAKTAVLDRVDELERQGRLDSSGAQRLRERIGAAQTLFALDDEVVLPDPILKKLFCRWPECFRPPAPSGKPGHPLVYCVDGRDEEGKLHGGTQGDPNSDHAQRSYRARKRLRAASGATPGRSSAVDGSAERPISLARETVAMRIPDLIAEIRALASKVDSLESTALMTVDDELRVAEIENIQAEAQRRVDEEIRRRLRAEAKQRELQTAHDKMAGHLEQADAAAEEAISAAQVAQESSRAAWTQADEAIGEAIGVALAKVSGAYTITVWATAAARYLAVWLVAEAQATAQWLAAEAQWKAASEVEAARAELERELQAAAERERDTERRAADEVAEANRRLEAELRTRSAEMDRQVAAANTARDEALAEATASKQAAARTEAAAAQSVRDANTASAEAKAETGRVREENTRLRNEALERETRHGEALALVRDKHRGEIAQLNGQLDEQRQRHQSEIERLRTETNTELERRLTEVRAMLEGTYVARLEGLTEANRLLTEAVAARGVAGPRPATDDEPPPA